MSEAGAEAAVRFARGLWEDPPRAVARWKAVSGGKAVGLLAARAPTEIVAAAGMLPVALWGDEFPMPRTASEPFHFPCAVVRTATESLRGKEWTGIFDALLLPATCDLPQGSQAGPEEERGLPVFRIDLPARPRGAGLEGLLDLFEALAEWAERVSGGRVRDGGLDKALRRENERRHLFETLARRMAEAPGLFSAAEYFAIARAGMLLPAVVHAEVLRAALGRGKRGGSAGPRIYVAGHTAPAAVFDRLDRAGAVLVGEGLAWGGGFYLEGTAEEGGDPLLSLARREAKRRGAGTAGGEVGGPQETAARAAECGAQGVIEWHLPACTAIKNGGELLLREGEQRGIAVLRIEADSLGEGDEWGAAIEAFTAALR